MIRVHLLSARPVRTLRQQMRSAKSVIGTWQAQVLPSFGYFVDVPAVVMQYDKEFNFEVAQVV